MVLGPATAWHSGRFVLECECGERVTFDGSVAVQEPAVASGRREALGYGEERSYSSLKDCLRWLEGKEARQEYYVRLY